MWLVYFEPPILLQIMKALPVRIFLNVLGPKYVMRVIAIREKWDTYAIRPLKLVFFMHQSKGLNKNTCLLMQTQSNSKCKGQSIVNWSYLFFFFLKQAYLIVVKFLVSWALKIERVWPTFRVTQIPQLPYGKHNIVLSNG